MARTDAADPAAPSPPTRGRGTGAATGILALQRTAGNAAVKRLLAREPVAKGIHVVEANAPPTPIGKGRGAGGGRLPDAPRLEVDRSGRVKLYRTIVDAELQALVKHGDFN